MDNSTSRKKTGQRIWLRLVSWPDLESWCSSQIAQMLKLEDNHFEHPAFVDSWLWFWLTRCWHNILHIAPPIFQLIHCQQQAHLLVSPPFGGTTLSLWDMWALEIRTAMNGVNHPKWGIFCRHMTILNPSSNLQKAAFGRNESYFNPANSSSKKANIEIQSWRKHFQGRIHLNSTQWKTVIAKLASRFKANPTYTRKSRMTSRFKNQKQKAIESATWIWVQVFPCDDRPRKAYMWIQSSSNIGGNHAGRKVKSGFKPFWNQVSIHVLCTHACMPCTYVRLSVCMHASNLPVQCCRMPYIEHGHGSASTRGDQSHRHPKGHALQQQKVEWPCQWWPYLFSHGYIAKYSKINELYIYYIYIYIYTYRYIYIHTYNIYIYIYMAMNTGIKWVNKFVNTNCIIVVYNGQLY